MVRRCEIESEILRVELERREGVRFVALGVGLVGGEEKDEGDIVERGDEGRLVTVVEE